MKPILLVLTGGTICSFGDENNMNRDLDITKAQSLLLSNFYAREDALEYKATEFETHRILNVLSENMTIDKWNELIAFLGKCDFSKYCGIIIAHGTDTLAYTSAMLAAVLNKLTIPVMMVSSQLPLNQTDANGNDNFKLAVELIIKGITPNVYVPYRNMNGIMQLHMGFDIEQSGNYSDDFYSRSAFVYKGDAETLICEVNSKNSYCEKEAVAINMGRVNLSDCVLKLEPYVGMNYDRISLEGIKAVVHGLYHCSTACVPEAASNRMYSVAAFIDKCKEKNIAVLITPCDEEQNKYISGNAMTDRGAAPINGYTNEYVYARAMVGCALGYRGSELISFVRNKG